MTRSTAPDVAAVLRVLESAGRALTASEIKQALQAGGHTKDEVDKAWTVIQRRIKAYRQVVVEGKTYRWVSPLDALDLLVKGELDPSKRAGLAEAVQAALQGDLESAARQRQERIDAVRELAELAGEVEELLANETEPSVMIRQVRAWVKRSGLDPVGKAGEQTKFDRKVHRPIDGPIRDGATVFVVRPGYVWKASDQDIVIGKAVVEE